MANQKPLTPAGLTLRGKFWREQIRKWSESGLTQVEYCEREDLSLAAFRWWKWHLGRRDQGRPSASSGTSAKPRLLPLRLVPSPSVPPAGSESVFEVVLKSGHRIRVPADFRSADLRRLIEAVEGCTC
jgi:hypothetical protein